MSRRKLPYALFIAAAPISAVVVYALTRAFLPAQLADMNSLPILPGDPRSPEGVLFDSAPLSAIASVVALVALWRNRPGERMRRYGRWAVLSAWR